MKTKVSFILPAEIVADATGGVLLGEFNNWNQNDGVVLKRSKTGELSANVSLESGQRYEYRYLLDNWRWVNDYNAPNQHDNCVIYVPEKAVTAKKVATKSTDDLTKIRGIGNKIAQLLIENGIDSFEKLSTSTFETLRAILDNSGSRGKSHDPTHWAKQAALAAAGKWDEFKKLHTKLKK